MQLLALARWPLDALDGLLDRLTSYRWVLYYLIVLLGAGVGVSLNGKIAYHWYNIVLSALFLSLGAWAVNKLLSKVLKIPANSESGLITGLILACILTPAASLHDYGIFTGAIIAAIASKYLLTVYKSHIFNPAAVGAFVSGAVFHSYASWWVGTKPLIPIIIVGGLILLRKMNRFQMFAVFLAIFGLSLIWTSPNGATTDAIRHLIWLGLISSPVLFFSTVMLTEPLTSPAPLNTQLAYDTLVGILYSWNRFHLSPEEALLIGNIFSSVFATKRRYSLKFKGSRKEAQGIYSFIFEKPPKFDHKAGQYMEWTLSGAADGRGNRRYLTIASAPSDKEVMVTVKLPEKPSAFKRRLATLKPNDTILAGHLSGSFVLPEDTSVKLAFMAGGVGITPFHSIIKHLDNVHQKRNISLFYSTNKPEEIAFGELFSVAKTNGIETVYTPTVDAETIASNLPDWRQRTFYVSGPYGYVKATERALLGLGVNPLKIITDYFPGYS